MRVVHAGLSLSFAAASCTAALDGLTPCSPGRIVSHRALGLPFEAKGGESFGRSIAALGDVNDDGVVDLAVGAPGKRDGGFENGAVYVLFLGPDGSVRESHVISGVEGGMEDHLHPSDVFGVEVAALGDLDGDEVPDLAVGAELDSEAGAWAGAVWLLSLRRDGRVRAATKLTTGQNGFAPQLEGNGRFGSSVARLPDLGADGQDDLLVGQYLAAGGGAAWIVEMASGAVKKARRIANMDLDEGDRFGVAAAYLGGQDLLEIAVGAHADDEEIQTAAGPRSRVDDSGAVHVLQLDPRGEVVRAEKISRGHGGFDGILSDGDAFGIRLSPLGDLDGNGTGDLAVGATGDDFGAIWILLMDREGHVVASRKLDRTTPPLDALLRVGDELGASAWLGDLEGDGTPELAVSALQSDIAGPDTGAVWLLSLEQSNSPHCVPVPPGLIASIRTPDSGR